MLLLNKSILESRSLRHVVSALDSEFVELGVAGEGVELLSSVCSSSAGSGVVIPTSLNFLQVITSRFVCGSSLPFLCRDS